MNKIKFKKARIKNFLSYGNTWQEFHFPEGLNLVQGYNVENGKSNGAGKSSIVEIVPFALFGKTIKNLSQPKIVNWFNRGGCEVKLYLEINGNNFTFIRGLRPNKFIVKKNDIEIVRPSDIKSFQYQMEDEVIGMDFKTFQNLIYFSPNNTISILGAKKDDKRKFLESLFDLSEYSDMLKITNNKIRSAEDRIKDTQGRIDNSERMKAMLLKSMEDIKIPDIAGINKNINMLTMTIEGLKDISWDTEAIKGIATAEDEISELKDSQMEFNNKINNLSHQITSLQDSIDSTDVDTPSRRKDEITAKRDALTEELSTIDPDGASDSMVSIREQIEEITGKVDTNKEEIISLDKRIEVNGYVITSNDRTIQTILGRADNISGKDICDFCGSECDHEKTRIFHETQIQEFHDENKRVKQNIDNDTKKVEALRKENVYLADQAKVLAEDYKRLKDQLTRHDSILKEIDQLDKQLELIPDVSKLLSDISEKKVKIDDLQKELTDITWKSDMNKEDIESKVNRLKDLKQQKEEYDKHTKRLEDAESKLVSEKQRLEDFQKVIHDLEADKKEKQKQFDSECLHITTYEGEISKLNKMLDHLGYLRVSLKDENVKQFAISSLLPFLNSRANYYLSESGFPYAVYIDGWLDVTIRGMGTEDVGYESLSGGESKAMDMAIQLACNDIAELHARTSLGISIYDEIFDTSLDADGAVKLMEIVKVKQRDTNNSVFCITHRDEIKELDFDNHIMIEKENGFSVIQTQTAMV